jgi:hypothetical protein
LCRYSPINGESAHRKKAEDKKLLLLMALQRLAGIAVVMVATNRAADHQQ